MSVAMPMNEPAAAWAGEQLAEQPTKLGQLAVAREMIASLHTLTPAGQLHMMGKILALLRKYAAPSRGAGGDRNQHTLTDLVERLSADSGRLWPDASRFSRCAESLVGLLAAVV